MPIFEPVTATLSVDHSFDQLRSREERRSFSESPADAQKWSAHAARRWSRRLARKTRQRRSTR